MSGKVSSTSNLFRCFEFSPNGEELSVKTAQTGGQTSVFCYVRRFI